MIHGWLGNFIIYKTASAQRQRVTFDCWVRFELYYAYSIVPESVNDNKIRAKEVSQPIIAKLNVIELSR